MKMKKIAALSLATVMVLGLSVPTFAQTKPVTNIDGNKASITIENAAKGESYTVYQLFDATVSNKEDNKDDPYYISYRLMEGKAAPTNYFYVDKGGNVHPYDGTGMNEAEGIDHGSFVLNESVLRSDYFKTWAMDYAGEPLIANVESDGTPLEFTKLPYGYYVIDSTQGGTHVITVDSTNPNAEVVDKNETTPKDLKKVVNEEGEEVSVGETVTYTVTFNTANFEGSKYIDTYTIEDTLPSWLSDVKVKSVKVLSPDGTTLQAELKDAKGDPIQFSNGSMTIDWVNRDAEGKITGSKYTNGSKVEIVYSATVNSTVPIGHEDPATNTVTLTWTVEGTKASEELEEKETIESYGLAIQKVDEDKKPLAGATFTVESVEYVTADSRDGHYTKSYEGEKGAVKVTELKCDENGYLEILGLESGKYTVTEVTAPDGYNKLTAPVEAEANVIGSTTSTKYWLWEVDEEGNKTLVDYDTTTDGKHNGEEALKALKLVVENKKGNELPSTGGIGTTIFYVVGGILVVGAGVVLVAKKRMNHEA